MPFDPPAPTPAERRELVPSAGLCASCAHLQIVRSARSSFVRCGRSDDDDRFARYPPLPRFACDGHSPAEP